MKSVTLFLALIAFTNVDLFGQSCPPNIDFEKGDFSNWECFVGYTYADSGKNYIKLDPSLPTPGRHEIISASSGAALDAYGGFPKLCPYGGSYSVKLGNEGTGAQAEGLSYTFTVPSDVDTFTFTYFYAVVFEDPAHMPYEQPRFFVTAYDVVSGEIINCASYDYVSNGAIPGFEVSKIRSNVLFKKWSPASLQFAGMKGRTVRLEFKTADCTLQGHFGYAYVDVGSACSNILATAPYCIETNSLILNAPYGFDKYTWYNENFTKIVGNAQSITLSPPPATSGTFFVDVVPYPGYGCRDTLSAVVTPLPVPDTPGGPKEFNYCQYQVGPALTVVNSPGNGILWYTTETGGIGSFDAPIPPTSVAGEFYYYATQKVLFGCESPRKKVTVKVLPTPSTSFLVNDDRQCLNGNQFVFTSKSINKNDTHYEWDFGDGDRTQSVDSTIKHVYKNAGYFYARLNVVNTGGCAVDRTLFLSIIPKPIANFSYPPVICEKQTPVNFIDNSTAQDYSSTIVGWWWSMDGNITLSKNPPAFVPSQPGTIAIRQVVYTSEGCRSDTNSLLLPVHYRPGADFSYGSLMCENEIIQMKDLSKMPVSSSSEFILKWNWKLDNNIFSPSPNPATNLTAGTHEVGLMTETNFGCKSDELKKSFEIFPKPLVKVEINDSCVNRLIQYRATDISNNTAEWYWDFGNGWQPDAASLTRTYSTKGARPFTILAKTDKGCKDTVIRPFAIYDNIAFAGKDTIVAKNEPVQLDAHGYSGSFYKWTPSTGLNDATIGNPIATLDRDQTYNLDVWTKEGCDSHSKIFIKRYAGPELYIPTAFSPNGDRKNDVLKVFPVGISAFHYFAVYNRYGQLVFRTTDYSKGWDGTFGGTLQDAGTFVVVAEAIDYKGKLLTAKGTVILLR